MNQDLTSLGGHLSDRTDESVPEAFMKQGRRLREGSKEMGLLRKTARGTVEKGVRETGCLGKDQDAVLKVVGNK